MQLSLDQLISGNLYALLLILVRIGGALMLMAGFGESFVPTRIRLLFAVLLSLILLPLVGTNMPQPPAQVGTMLRHIGGEVMVGVLIGIISRLMVSALDMAGTMIAFSINLSNIFGYNLAMSTQSSAVANFLGLVGLTVLFAADMHHSMLRILAGSYATFPPMVMPAAGDLSEVITRLVGYSFKLAVQLTVPFMVVGIMINLSFGLIGKLVPSLQVFFLATPAVVGFGFLLLAIALPTMMAWFLQSYDNSFSVLLRPN
jgi:flagellar biosynthetic protein FliR